MAERRRVFRARPRLERCPGARQSGSHHCECIHAAPRRRENAAHRKGGAPEDAYDRDIGTVPRGTRRIVHCGRRAWRPTGDCQAVHAARPGYGSPWGDRLGTLSLRSPQMSQATASGSLLADATRAARLRLWIAIVGVLAIAAFAASAAYDAWRSYNVVISANKRELGNLAKALAEQAERSLQLADLLLRETATWYETERPAPGNAADAKLATR